MKNNVRNVIPWIRRIIFGEQTFKFGGKRYFYHKHPFSFDTERVVEVPLLRAFLKKHKGKKILEVGNVSHNHSSVKTLVVDKYEDGLSVFNIDAKYIAYYTGKINTILSVSTIEHIGYDEHPIELEKAMMVFWMLNRLLLLNAPILITFPIGYHPLLHKQLSEVTGMRYMSRNYRNEWFEVNYKHIEHYKYNSPFRHANAIAIYWKE